MALQRKLKNMNLFREGAGMLGTIAEVTLPKLTAKTESGRYGGMLGEVEFNMGVDKLELSYKVGGFMQETLANFGAAKLGAEMLRWAGAYQDDSTGDVYAVEVITRGNLNEADFGTAKVGEGGEQSHKLSLTYYKLTVDGQEIVEIDMISGLLVVNGVDQTAAIRNAIS